MRKKLLIGTLAVFVFLFGFMLWYDATYSMEEIETSEINTPNQEKKILIATQGSEYKNGIVNNLTRNLETDRPYIKIVDVKLLNEVNPDDWDALVIIHTWEIWKPEENAKNFLNKSYDASKIMVLATSGSGDNQIDGVDGMTGASELDKVEDVAEEITKWLKEKLK